MKCFFTIFSAKIQKFKNNNFCVIFINFEAEKIFKIRQFFSYWTFVPKSFQAQKSKHFDKIRIFRQFLLILKHFELSAICKVYFFPSLLTELPMLTSVFCARCTRLSPTLTAKARVMWDENSTEIPTAITKFTNDTAFNVIFHLKNQEKKLQN